MNQQSRRFAIPLLVLLIMPPTGLSCAQAPSIPRSNFTLALSLVEEDPYYKGIYSAALTETNISNEVLIANACAILILERNLRIIATFNGIPLQMDMRKPVAQVRERVLNGDGGCTKVLLHPLQPGGGKDSAFDAILNLSAVFDMSKPGTYTFAVTRETDPDHPDKSVTVKSNTVTLVIPNPLDH